MVTRPVLRSLRIRLLVMTLLAILPALLLMILSARERRDLDGRNVQQEALRLVVFAAGNLQRDVHAARAFLGALTQDLRWRRGDPSQCAENLRKIQERTNLYSAVGVADSTGQVVCQSTGTVPYPSLARTAWFQEAMHTREFSVGYDGDHTLFQKVTMDFAQPILMPNGKRMVFFCALKLDWLNDLATRVQLPENSTVTVLGSRNQVLVRYPDPDRWVGNRLDVDPLAASLSQGPRGVAEALGLDGVKRLYAFTEIPEGRLSLRLGIPSALAYAAADRAMRHNLLWLGAATLLALMATWLVGNWMMARPIDKLVAATRKLASGNLTARTDMDYSSGELGHLARAFDEMAESLEWREAQLR
ncbi:MAG TPA: HAMP domain-containing protein, partial [Fibrobacteria bacterium]|nr:HAMP domain-containing protein [Fibrobacteria bacterium]